MRWDFQLDEHGVVQLAATVESHDGVLRHMREQVRPGGNFCGVKYAALRVARRGALEVSWLRLAKWQQRFR